jgi:hypothetical protein
MRNISDKIVKKIKIRVLYSAFFFSRKSYRLRENVEKVGGSREDAGNVALVRDILDK